MRSGDRAGWNGHPRHLQCFHAAMFKSWRCSHIPLPMTEESAWSEATSNRETVWNDVVGDEVIEPFEWWQVQLFQKSKCAKEPSIVVLNATHKKTSISDDHPTLHRHSPLWLFRWWWNASNSLRLFFQLVKNTPSYPAKEQKWMTGKEIQQLRPAKRPARDKHSKATHKVKKAAPMFVCSLWF